MPVGDFRYNMVDNVDSCLDTYGIRADLRVIPSLKIVTDTKANHLRKLLVWGGERKRERE